MGEDSVHPDKDDIMQVSSLFQEPLSLCFETNSHLELI